MNFSENRSPLSRSWADRRLFFADSAGVYRPLMIRGGFINHSVRPFRATGLVTIGRRIRGACFRNKLAWWRSWQRASSRRLRDSLRLVAMQFNPEGEWESMTF